MRKKIVVIPARGGSKGIPRKNLRPLNGKPLISYSITKALKTKGISEVFVSTEDHEIALISKRFGAKVVFRNDKLADDTSTLDQVIFSHLNNNDFGELGANDLIITIQPTSPLINQEDILKCITFFEQENIDTVISVVDDRHLTWKVTNGQPQPNYKERVNRQSLAECYKETGSIIACTVKQGLSGSRIGKNIRLLSIEQLRSFDIDNFSDFYLCEAILKRKKIVIVVIGDKNFGLGHVARALLLANELVNYEITFLCEEKWDLAIKVLGETNYNLIVTPNESLIEYIREISPELVISDILDTSKKYIQSIKQIGSIAVNFEDLGDGAKYADLVFNDLYPQKEISENAKWGYEFFCLRDEFIYGVKSNNSNSIKSVLLAFGGTDAPNLTKRFLKVLASELGKREIDLHILIGPGYSWNEELSSMIKQYKSSHIFKHSNIQTVSELMSKCDIAITSGGRTVYELASLAVPAVVVCQNDREATHLFLSETVSLGMHDELSNETFMSTILEIIDDHNYYQNLVNSLKKINLKDGKKRVVKLITDLIGEKN